MSKMILKKISILMIGITLISCEQKIELQKNKNLIGFKSEMIGEIGDDEYIKMESLAESKKIEAKQIEDILIIKTWKFRNTCGNYEEDISINSDTIYLKLNLVSDEVCSSRSIVKLTYLVYNPENKKWIIK